MIYIAHRINTLAQLQELDRTDIGLELDLRDRGDRLILQHDPFSDGEDFEPLLAEYVRRGFAGPMILNIKSERIEHRVGELIKKHGLHNYFYLDSSFPMLRLLSEQGETNLAVRYSEYEGLDTVMAMRGRARWVWVDCFSHIPLTPDSYRSLKDAGFLLCFVSPELQGRDADIEPYKAQLMKDGIIFDAICTKSYNIGRWA